MTDNAAQRLTGLISACKDINGTHLLQGSELSAADLQALQAQLALAGFYICEIDGQAASDEMALVIAIGQAFQFPGYFGRNWNAVDECITDLSWLKANGYVCLLRSATTLSKANQQGYPVLLDVFQTAADTWRQHGIPFKLMLA